MPEDLQIHTIVSRPFQENTYVVWQDGRRECLVIDPGFEPELIIDLLRRRGLTPAAILLTHGHGDHIAGNTAVRQAFPDAPILIGELDEPMLTDPYANMSAFFGFSVTSPPAQRVLKEGDRLDLAGVPLEVRHVPGHSPGHVVFIYRGRPIHVFGGDVLFDGSIGRTDLPDGDGPTLIAGIQDKLLTLPDDTVVHPGHGPATTVGRERQHNPFVGRETLE